MAPTRKTAETLAQGVKTLLNRPEEDDLFHWPDEYLAALSKAHRRVYKKIAQHSPNMLATNTTVATLDGGVSYELGDFHLGGLEVWAPPGPPIGERIPPALPESPYFGFWVDGTTLKLTLSTVFDPLYIKWTPDSVEDLEADDYHSLPAFCEDMLEYEAAYIMAQKPGFAGNADVYALRAAREWVGDRNDPSDMGILGTIKRLAMNEGFEASAGGGNTAWWRTIR